MSERLTAAKAQALLDAAPKGTYEALHPDDMPGRSVVVGGSERFPPYDAFVVALEDSPRVALAELFAASPALAREVTHLTRELDEAQAELTALRDRAEATKSEGDAARDFVDAQVAVEAALDRALHSLPADADNATRARFNAEIDAADARRNAAYMRLAALVGGSRG